MSEPVNIQSYPSPIVTIDMGDDGNIIYGGSADYVGMVTNPGYVPPTTNLSFDDHYSDFTKGPTKITDGPHGRTAMKFDNDSRIFLTKPSGQGGVTINSSWTIDCYIKNNGPGTKSKILTTTYESHSIWLGQIRTDTNILGVYHIQVSTDWDSSNAVLVPDGTWVRLTIVCDGSTTKFYTNGNDTPIGSQNHSYPRVEDTGGTREVFIVGNADYNRKGIGDLYGFRLYDQNYLPSEIEDPILAPVTHPSPIVTIDMGDDGNIIYGGSADYVGMVTNPGYVPPTTNLSFDDHYSDFTKGPTKITDGPHGRTAMKFDNDSRIFLTKPSGQGGVTLNSTWTIDCYIKNNGPGTTHSKILATTYESHTIWLGQIQTDSDIIGVYNIPVSTDWSNTSAVLVSDGTWMRLTIVCDGNTTKFYVNGTDTPIGSQNHSYPRAEDTGGTREVFIVGNYDYNRKGIGDLYGFRLYDQNYLPSEI